MPELPRHLNILVMADEPLDLEAVRAVAPGRLTVHQEQPAAFEDEAGMFPPPTGLISYRRPWRSDLTPEERERLLREAHVLVCSIPYPLHLRERMPSLLWTHCVYAGVSDFKHSDLWGSGVRITSSRGEVQALPIAEMVIAAIFHFAKQLSLVRSQMDTGRLDGSAFHLRLVAGSTLAVIGLGGIGKEIARLAKALGMRVVATRRSTQERLENVDGADVVYPGAELPAALREADFVAVAAALTPQTERLLDAQAFAAMKDGAYIMNVARGEVIDEPAMKDALRSGKLGGAYLDVYAEERTRPPDPELMAMPNVLITPHNSGETDVDHWPMTDVFVRNLRRFLAGEPLLAEVDWQRGY